MGTLSREAIDARDDLGEEYLEVPEWGGVVRVRGLTAAERDLYEASLFVNGDDKPDLSNARAKLAALGLVDDDGKPLYGLAQAEALGRKSATAVDRVAAAVRRLSRMGAQDGEQALGN